MALNSETSVCNAARSEGVTRGVAGVTNSQNAVGIQRTSVTRVGSCRPVSDTEAVQRRNALSQLPNHSSWKAAISQTDKGGQIHPSRRALILHPNKGCQIHPSRRDLIMHPDRMPFVVNDTFSGVGKQETHFTTRSGSVLFWSLTDVSKAYLAGSLMAKVAEWRPETLLLASERSVQCAQGCGTQESSVRDGLTACGYYVEVASSSSGRCLIFATTIPLLSQVRTLCPNDYSCIIEAHLKNVTIIGALAPGWSAVDEQSVAMYIRSMDVVRTLRGSFENALAEVVQCARRRNSAEGVVPIVLLGDMQVAVNQDPRLIPYASRSSKYLDEEACRGLVETLGKLQLKDVFDVESAVSRQHGVSVGCVTYFPSERCRTTGKGLKLDYLMVSETLMAVGRNQGLYIEEAHSQFFGMDSILHSG